MAEDDRPEKNRPVIIPDECDGDGAPTDARVFPAEYAGHLRSVLIPHEAIVARTRALAGLIRDDYEGRRPVLVCVLKGAAPFFHLLTSALAERGQGFSTEFVRASSYRGATTESSGEVGVAAGETDFGAMDGRPVVLVEDIVDTGTTLARLVPYVRERGGAESVEVCTLLEKRLGGARGRPQAPATRAKYAGFSVPDKFVVGFGLDYNELYRDLRDIWVISQAGIDFDGRL